MEKETSRGLIGEVKTSQDGWGSEAELVLNALQRDFAAADQLILCECPFLVIGAWFGEARRIGRWDQRSRMELE